MPARPPITGTTLSRILRNARTAIFRAKTDESDTESSDQHAITRTRRYWDDNIALTLANIAHEGETKASGRVQLISLADFRTAIGELWDQYQDRILLIAETTIGRMIGKGQIFIPMQNAAGTPQGTDTWLLLMPDLDEAAAAAHAEAIAGRIGDKLMGANFSLHEPPVPLAATLDLTGVMSADGSLDLEVLKAAVAKAKHVQAPVAATPPVGVTARQETRRVTATVVLRPGWCVGTETEDAFFLRPISATGEELMLDPAVTCPETIAINLCGVAERLLGEMERNELRAKLTLPIPYPLLYTPAAATLRAAIMAMPRQSRLLHLRLEIVRVPPQATAEQLAILRDLFRPVVREVAFLVDVFAAQNDVFALDHISIGADVSAARGWDESDLRTALAHMRRGAGRRYTYVLGLRSRDHVNIALAAGIDEIGAQTLSSDLENLPGHLRVISRSTVTAP